MVADQENDFQNGLQKSFWKTYMSICFEPVGQFWWSKFPVGGGGFQGAKSIGKGFNMTWSKDHAKFKMAAILIRSFLEMLLAMLGGITLRRDMGLGNFLKWPPWKSNFGNISTFKWQIILVIILVSDTYVFRLKKSNETT